MVNANSLVFGLIRSDDKSTVLKNRVPTKGAFTINLAKKASGETSIGFMVVNQ
jgi:hypothetical protein